jgi:hypothetical protein
MQDVLCDCSLLLLDHFFLLICDCSIVFIFVISIPPHNVLPALSVLFLVRYCVMIVLHP